MRTFLQNYEYFCTSEEEFFPDIYNSAFEIAKKVEHAKYPSDKLKLLKDAFTQAQISQGLCNLGEDDDQVKITPLSEDIQLAVLKHIGLEEILFMAYVC